MMDQPTFPPTFPPKNQTQPQPKPDWFSPSSQAEPSGSEAVKPSFSPFGTTVPVSPSESPTAVPSPIAPNTPVSKPSLPVKLKIKSILPLVIGLVLLVVIVFLIIRFFSKKKLGEILPSKVTLTYWGLFEPVSVFQQVIEDYQKENPKIKINYSQENLKEYRLRLQAALERKEGPDIFRIHQSWVPMLGKSLAAIPESIYSPASFERSFYPSARESLKFNGQYVAIPLMVDGLSLFYNVDTFKAADKQPPATWEDLKRVACGLTVKDEQGKIKIAGVALGTTGNIDHWSDILGTMMLQNGADLANPSQCRTNSPDEGSVCLGRDALTFYTLFASDQACQGEEENKGAVWSSLLPSSTYAFATGSLAMYFGPSWRVFDIKGINNQLNFKIIPVPQLPGGNVAWSSYWVEAVSKNSAYQEEAWKFLQYLSSEKVLQKLYQTQSVMRLFGEPYPRIEMADQLKSQPLVSAFVEQAPFAKNWYLSSFTADEGINKQIIQYYEDAVNAVGRGEDPLSVLTTTTQGVAQVLRQYELTR